MPGIEFGIFIVLILLGLFVGGWSERSHFRHLERRELETKSFPVTQIKSFIQAKPDGKPPMMVVTEVVIASDYFKTFAAGLRNLFGGEVKTFERMMERARREANLRLIEQAQQHGYSALCNVRINTANVAGMSSKANAMATILGWATAYEINLPAEHAQQGTPPVT